MFSVIMVKLIKRVGCLLPSGVVPKIDVFFFIIFACTRIRGARFGRGKYGRNEDCGIDAEEKGSIVRHFGFRLRNCFIAMVHGVEQQFLSTP